MVCCDGSINCRFCGKSFNRGFNLRRHESEYCPLQDHSSSIESGSDQSTGRSTKRKYADTDDSTSESDSDHSDYTDEDQENEHETDPWASLKMEAMTKNMPESQELTETSTAGGLEEEEAMQGQGIFNDSAKASKRLAKYLSKSSSMDRTNEERSNSQTDYENERTPLQTRTILTQKKLWRLLLMKENF